MSSLKELKAMGGFVSDVPVKKNITFQIEGEDELSADIHVRKLSAGDYETIFVSETEGRSRTASIISQCVTLGADGKEKISFEDAYRLHPDLARAMINAFNEVNASKKILTARDEFLHDLALALGMTVGELGQRMTNAELNAWISYVEKNGPMNQMLRIESAVARAVSPFLKNATPKDLMVWPRQPEREGTAEELALMFKNLASRTNNRKH